MIQWTRNNSVAQTFCPVYVNIYDEMTATTYNPLIAITSQSTNKTKYVIPGLVDLTNKERYVKLAINISNNGTDSPTAGIISIGDSEFPYGFYDVVIYQNSSAVNLDPSGLTKIWNGLMNLTAASDAAPVTYSEYTTNDSDTESVYITF